MNYIDYWWTKLRLRIMRHVVRWTKKQLLLDIRNSRRAVKLLENPYKRFTRVSEKQEELAVHLKRIIGQNSEKPILDIRFDTGMISCSHAVDNKIPPYHLEMALVRHRNGDWGDVSSSEWTENNRNLQNGCGVVLSKYHLGKQLIFQIETDLTKSKTRVQMGGKCA